MELLYNYHKAFFQKGAAKSAFALRPKFFSQNTEGGYFFAPLRKVALLALMVLFGTFAFAQQSNVLNPLVSPVPMVNGSTPSFTVTSTNSSFTTGGNAIDNNLTNKTNGAGSGVISIKVSDGANTYSAGNTVGFRADQGSGSFVIKLYNNGTLVQTSPAITATGVQDHAIVATAAYDEVELVYTRTVILFVGSTIDVYYAFNRAYAAGTSPTCTSGVGTSIALSQPAYPLTATSSSFGLGASVTNASNAISALTTDVATLVSPLLTNASLEIKDNVTNYPATTFAGLDISHTAFTTNDFSGITLKTYLNGTLKETKTGNSELTSLAGLGTNRQTIGFVASQAFDEIQLAVAGNGTTTVYSMVVSAFCAGPAVVCGNQSINFPTNPVTANVSTLLGAASVANPTNVVSASTTDFATLTSQASGTASMVIKDQVTNYAAGLFIGLDVENVDYATDQFSGLTITTYLNGTQKESITGSSLISLGLTGNRQTVGVATTQAFDEVKITFLNGDLFAVHTTKVYGMTIKKYCAGPALTTCNTPTPLVDPTYPVTYIGNTSALAIGSGVTGAANVISASTTDFTTLALGTGSASIAVKDQVATYPAGTFAGFDVENIDFVADSFGGLTVTTYLNGVQQEQSGTFTLLVIANSEQSLVNSGVSPTGRQTVGFVATKAFDEIKLSYAKIDVPISNNEHATKVYSAIVDARCSGANLVCNVRADYTYPAFPVSEYSGQLGGCLAALVGQGALVSADTSDYVTFVEGLQVGCATWVGVKNNRVGDVYPAGTFAGFETAEYGFVSISLADVGTVTTYLDGVQQEVGNSLNLIATSFVTGQKRTVGFKTTLPFDEVRYTKVGVVSASAGVTRVYKAVVEKICPGPALECNVKTRLSKGAYPLTTSSYMVPYGVVVGCLGSLTGEENLITPDTSDFALMTMTQSLGCYRHVSVKDNATTYPAGTFAGYEIQNMSLITASLGDLQSVITYLNGVEQERTVKGSLITANILSGGRQTFGFVTTKPFNEVKYEEFTVITPLTFVATRIYGVVVQKFCAGAPLTCTTPNANPGDADYVRLNLGDPSVSNVGYPMTLTSNSNDAFLGVSLCTNQLLNPENAISPSTTDYATIALTGVNCAASLTFTENLGTYNAGTFAGVEIENTGVASLNLVGGITVQTYLNGTLQEWRSGAGLIGGSFGSSAKKRVGFVTSKQFDEIKYIQGQLVGVNLGITKVYGAVVRELCAASPLVCNAKTKLTAPTYPVSANAGFYGVCLSGVTNAEALTTADTADFAYFTLGANVLCKRYVAVKDHKTTYPAGTYASFDVQFGAVVEVALNSYKIETWLNGVKQEEADASMQISYGLYAGTLRFPVGFKTTMPFDEVRYVLGSLAAASISEVRVYGAYLTKMCEPTLACNQTYNLTPNGATGFPVVVDGTKSGITGACLGCYIKDAENILSSSTTDYAEIGMFLSALNEAKIAVKNPQTTYPLGTRVGFTYQNVNGVFDAALFNATTVRTFLNGVQQESKSATNLLEVPILTSWSAASIKNIGFTATMPFDEVQLAFSNTTGVFRVYGAFIDTRSSTAGTGPLAACVCNAGDVAPILSAATLNNACPTTTVDLSTLTASNLPVGTTLTWHTDTIAVTANKVADPTLVAVSGKYYAAFYDAVNGCYSLATAPVVVSANSCVPIFTFDCGTATSTGTFTANATAGQTGILIVPMTGVTAGSATFTVTGTGFTGTLSTIIAANQASVSIPIVYDGTGAAGSRTLTVTSSQGIGACTPSVSVIAPVVNGSSCLLSLPILSPVGTQLSLPNFCTRNGYNYYKALAGSLQELLAINQNGNTFNPTSVTIDAMATGTHSLTSGGKTTALASRMVSILAPGSYTVNGGMTVRIYYDPTEFASLPTANRRWFKHPAHTKAAVLADLSADSLANAKFLTPSSTGTENGISYVEFTNIQSFSTFGYAASTAASFTFNCGTASSTGTFTANATAGQTGSLTIPLTNATAGDATFTVTGTGFTGTLTTTLTANQASVNIPITYDGTGAAGSRTLTVTSSEGTGSCTPSVSVAAAVTCATPTVGGTAAYTGGTLCDASNIGTAMLTGQTGNIVRWETSTNSGGSWSPIASTNTYYNFANAANGQQYRAVVNNGSGCSDANSAVATIATSATACTSTTCDNTTGNITFTVVTPPSNANLKSHFIMTNNSGVIQYASAKDSVKINGVAVGDYLVYRVVYDSTQLPLPTVTVGTNINAIGGACVKFTNQLAYKVCPATVPDLVTIIGQPSPTLQVGVTSNLPITVRNIGTGSAPGIITTTITLPTGVTAPVTFTSNGWTCSTTAPSVTCTNPGPIAAGRDSTFNVPITPNASIVGTNPIFNATTNPVTGETNTSNNTATPTATTSPVAPASAGAPDLITIIGQPTPTLQVNQTSNLPVTIRNIGTGSALGVITTTITIPAGVTAPANFASNAWGCTTTGQTVTCTNAGPILAGRDSTFLIPITPNASTSGTGLTFNGTTNPVAGETNTSNNAATPLVTTPPVVGGSLLSIKVLLQGNYDPTTGWMHDSLRKNGLIPLSDPYRTAAYSSKFTHKKNGATQTTTNAILGITGANAIVDWVFIELHDAANPATVIATKAALLQRDGDVVSAADGISPVYMDSIASGNYYVAIRHRNHLGVMTATTRPLSATSTVVDFTTLSAANLWNKTNGDGYETTQSGVRNLLWAGDTDGNRQTVFAGATNDTDPVFFDVMTAVQNVNFVPNYILRNQYLASDVNMDGKVIYQSADNEVDIILFMVLSHTLNTNFLPSFIIAEQLP